MKVTGPITFLLPDEDANYSLAMEDGMIKEA